MTKAQEQYHQEDVRVIAENLIKQANSRGWGNLVPDIFSELNEKLTVKLPEPVREDRITAYANIQFIAPEGSEDWTQRVGQEWYNAKFRELEALVPGMTIGNIDRYAWDRISGQYKLPEADATTSTDEVAEVAESTEVQA